MVILMCNSSPDVSSVFMTNVMYTKYLQYEIEQPPIIEYRMGVKIMASH